MAKALLAETHSAEYLLHKYWSRKPANIVRKFIECYTKPDSIVVDPVCGSGVTLIESAKLGRKALGCDLNPAAVALARVSLTPLDTTELAEVADQVLQPWKIMCQQAYTMENGREIDHCVHALILTCEQCSRSYLSSELIKQGRGYKCPECGKRLPANLKRSAQTAVIEIAPASESTRTHQSDLHQQDLASQTTYVSAEEWRPYDIPLIVNTRILAYEGMSTSSLFTHRNFTLLAALTNLIYAADTTPKVRDALLLLVTSSVASCSRLIAYRDNLKGGGPAWSVPGFWVPAIHLERNPLLHISARLPKLIRGVHELSRGVSRGSASVNLDDGVAFLRGLTSAGVKADYIFADPPYGDSIPYLEFSQIWNCWLKSGAVETSREIVVSDRVAEPAGWDQYNERLASLITACAESLSAKGIMTLSFNNLDPRAWYALMLSLRKARLWCIDVVYQVPAVISAKAQFSPEGSYLGDVYASFRLAEARECFTNADAVESHLEELTELRGESINRATATRAVAMIVLESNVAAEAALPMLKRAEAFPTANGTLHKTAPLYRHIRQVIGRLFKLRSSALLAEIWTAVADSLPSWAVPDYMEVATVLQSEGYRCNRKMWTRPEGQALLSLTSN